MSDDIQKITMPKWGLSMQEGTIVEWLAAEGSAITKGDEIAEIETEKVNNGYEAPCSGLLRRHVATTGQTIPVGGLIAVVAPADVTDDEIDSFIATFEAAFVPEPTEDEASAPQTVEINGRVINSQPESDDLCSSGVMFLEFDEADRRTYQKHFTALKSALEE